MELTGAWELTGIKNFFATIGDFVANLILYYFFHRLTLYLLNFFITPYLGYYS